MTEVVGAAVSWIYKLFILLIVASIAVMFVAMLVSNEVNTAPLQGALMQERILYSPHAIWHKEGSMVVPGVVDRARFNQATLDAAFVIPNQYGGAKLVLKTSTDETTLYVARVNYELIEVTSSLRGGGGRVRVARFPVVVKTGNTYENGVLELHIAEVGRA